MHGAVAAIKKGCTVILADKAWVGSSGESTFAAGDILYYDPEQDDMHEWLERWNKAGDSMFDPEWLEWYGKNVHELILMLDSWGMEFEKDAQGRFKRKPGRGHREAVVFPGYKMQKKLRGILEKLGVVIVDRVMITELLTSGRPCGRGYGLQCPHGPVLCVRSEEYGPFHGRVQLQGTVPRQDMVSGEGNDMAPARGRGIHQHGIRQHLQRHRQGLRHLRHDRFQCLGRPFHQRPCRTFMHKYDPVQGEGAMLHHPRPRHDAGSEGRTRAHLF